MKHKAGSGNVPVFHCFIYPVLDVHFKFHEKAKLTEDNKKKCMLLLALVSKNPSVDFFMTQFEIHSPWTPLLKQ